MATRSEVQGFNVEDVCRLLTNRLGGENDDVISIFRSNRIDGPAFLELTDDELKELVPILGERKAVKRIMTSYTTHPSQSQRLPTVSLFIRSFII